MDAPLVHINKSTSVGLFEEDLCIDSCPHCHLLAPGGVVDDFPQWLSLGWNTRTSARRLHKLISEGLPHDVLNLFVTHAKLLNQHGNSPARLSQVRR